MSAEAVSALLLPFSQGLLPTPAANAPAAVLRAEDGIPASWRAVITCEQSYKPAAEALEAAGFTVVPRLEEEGAFATVLVLLTKHKEESRALIARALRLVQPGGVVVCSGEKDSGAASLEKQMGRECPDLLIGQSVKNRCRVFWLRRGEALPPVLAEWEAAAALQPAARDENGGGGRYLSRPGLFGWEKIDRGSRLLASVLSTTPLKGVVADLGAGWGYLSVQVLRHCPAVETLHLYEAEALALEAAQANLAALCPERASLCQFHWADVAAGLGKGRFLDGAVCNPPFHAGKHSDSSLGQAFLRRASDVLRPNGVLLLVANRHLPYESLLAQRFRHTTCLLEAEGFKVLKAIR